MQRRGNTVNGNDHPLQQSGTVSRNDDDHFVGNGRRRIATPLVFVLAEERFRSADGELTHCF